jgi:MtrB/PioB family decaheme-associated outer membrane protein
MMILYISAVLAISLFLATPMLFAGEPELTGELSLTGLLTNEKGNKAKFNEYRDLQDGAYGKAGLLYNTDTYFLGAQAYDMGYDTQRYQLDGGVWDAFKATGFYRESPHNTTFGASSMFTGQGSGSLQLPPAVNPNDATTWPTSFDYSTKRREGGGKLSIDIAKPFFLDVSGSSEQRKGIRPAGFFDAITPFEVPEPVNYRTNTIKADLGYARKPFFADLYFIYSDFDNKNSTLNFPNTTLGITDPLTLPPDNSFYKGGFKGAVKLPLNSKFNVNAGWSRATSNADLLTADPIFGAGPLALNKSVFHGKVDTQNAEGVLTSNPIDFLDVKAFYKYFNRDNKSDTISQSDGVSTFINQLFTFSRNTFGGELGFRIPMNFYLSGGYTRVLTERPLVELANTRDDIVSADLRWKGLSFMTVRTGYERLMRNAHFNDGTAWPANIPQNVAGARSFDMASKNQDSIKLNIDLYPTDYLSFGLGYKHKEINYRGFQYGLKGDRRDEGYASADLTVSKYAQFFAYFDYEMTRRSQDQLDESVAPAFGGWNLRTKEEYYDFGAGVNFFILPKKLTLRVQYDYARSNGNADFTLSSGALGNTNLPPGTNNSNADIGNWENYIKQSLMVKFIYNVTKNITASIGYAYEKFRYSDAQLDNYALIPTTGGVPDAYLTGAYAKPNYSVNLYFATLSYRFW